MRAIRRWQFCDLASGSRRHPIAAWYTSGMKGAFALAVLLASSLLPAVATGQTAPGVDHACPGRVNVIEAVEHPGNLDAAGTGVQRSAWAMRTQDAVTACVEDGTISPAYGYYLGLKIDARIVRYVFCTSNDPTVRRNTLATFDRLFIESRPTVIGTTFEHLADELRDRLHTEIGE